MIMTGILKLHFTSLRWTLPVLHHTPGNPTIEISSSQVEGKKGGRWYTEDEVMKVDPKALGLAAWQQYLVHHVETPRCAFCAYV